MKIKSELIPAIGLIILSISGCDFSQKHHTQSYELKVSETAITDQKALSSLLSSRQLYFQCHPSRGVILFVQA